MTERNFKVSPGQVAYETFVKAMGFYDYTPWAHVDQTTADAWEDAASAVKRMGEEL